MQNKPSIKILISCHKESDFIKSEIFQPIQLNCANTSKRYKGMLYDDEGDNISKLNPMYCELTAPYWAWKNLDVDYYGFCHYRRYFNFAEKQFKYNEDAYGNVIEKFIDKTTIDKYGLNDENVQKLVEQYDVITTSRKDIRLMPERFKSVTAQYEAAKLLHNKDIKTVLDIIDELYPEYSQAAHKHCEGHITSFCNMYILRKKIFFDYCEWMFSILAEFCQRTDMTHYSTEALRTPGHLSERLFGIYYLHLLENNPNLKVKELQCILFQNTEPQNVLKPAFGQSGVPVVFAANNNFVPVFAACLQSLLDHASAARNYDIVLLQSDVTKDNKEELLRMVCNYPNVSLRFFDASRLLFGYDLKANAHISVETYYRFLIQAVLPEYDKILYLDCDIIIKADVAELYDTDIEGYMLAAVRDADFLGQINGYSKDSQEYIKKDFCMKDPFNYFQAGVLLFNEKEMREAYTLDQWLTLATHRYKFNDQDVLNLYCEGRVKYLDMSWNLITDCDHFRVANVIVHAPDGVQREYREARKHPKIIHYAGFMKPWHRPTEDFAHEFWMASKRTPYYEELLFRLMDGVCYWQIFEHDKANTPRGFLAATKKNLRKVADKVFPKGSRRREKLKRLIGR